MWLTLITFENKKTGRRYTTTLAGKISVKDAKRFVRLNSMKYISIKWLYS